MTSVERDPYGRPAWARTLAKLWAAFRAISEGGLTKYPPWVRGFERDFAARMDCRYGLTFCNGTSSLEAALFALKVRPGDRVLVPALTFHAAITPVLNAGAEAVFVDVNPETANVCLSDFERKARGVKAAVVTHMWGNPTPMRELEQICRRLDIALVEDCSLAVGARWEGRPLGSFGEIGFFSLQQEKAVSAGEGGICVTDRRELWERMAYFGHFNRIAKEPGEAQSGRWPVCGVGHKRRAHPLGIALAAVDLRNLDADNAQRRRAARELAGWLEKLAGLKLLFEHSPSVWGGSRNLALLLGVGSDAERKARRLRQVGLVAQSCNYQRWHLNNFFRQPDFRLQVLWETGALPQPGPLDDDCPAMEGFLERLLLLQIDRSLLRQHRSQLLEILAEA